MIYDFEIQRWTDIGWSPIAQVTERRLAEIIGGELKSVFLGDDFRIVPVEQQEAD